MSLEAYQDGRFGNYFDHEGNKLPNPQINEEELIEEVKHCLKTWGKDMHLKVEANTKGVAIFASCYMPATGVYMRYWDWK